MSVETVQNPAPEAVRIDSVERLSTMTREQVDDLPYGFIVLDSDGIVLLYNRYEARMSRIEPERVIGRNFFQDIAPCTRVEAFYGRFRALVASPTRSDDRFAFRFHFLHGAQDVIVQFARAPEVDPGARGAGARIFMTVVRRALDNGREAPPRAVTLDADRGRVTGPLGPAFPLGGPQLASVLGWLGVASARELGRELGRSIAALASDGAQRTGELRLKDAPELLVSGAIDEAMACAGLGRLALDLTPRAQTGVFGCLLRPAIEIPSRGLSALYEGVLEAALGAALEGDMVARCIDDRELGPAPWRFAVAPLSAAAALERLEGERADDMARRLGLLVDEL